jgi:peptide/nickel transport system substrate-binding protein
MRLKSDGSLEPGLALSAERKGPLAWRFALRPGVKFSNGKSFNADAVVAAVNYLVSPESTPDFVRNELPTMTGAKRIDDLTVEIYTAEPEPIFPRHTVGLLIVEPNAWKTLGREGFAKSPVGTGPFKVDTWETGKVRLSAFEGSWRAPKAARLELVEIPNRVSRVQAILSKQVDIALDLSPEDTGSLEGAGGKLISWSDGGVQGISFAVTRDGPFNDIRVRQALNYGVQKTQLVDQVLNGMTAATGQPGARTTFGHNPDIKPYPYDPDRAKKLLAEAGYSKGLSFTMDGTTASPAAETIYQVVATDLKKIGVDMRINIVPRIQFLTNLFGTGQYSDSFAMFWGTQPSLDAVRAAKLHSCIQKHAWYCDPTVTPLINEALTTADEKRGLQLRHDVMRHYHEQAPAIFLYETVLFAGLSAKAQGYEDNYGFVRYENVDVTR